MDGFIVNITIEDCVRDNCSSCCRQKMLTNKYKPNYRITVWLCCKYYTSK